MTALIEAPQVVDLSDPVKLHDTVKLAERAREIAHRSKDIHDEILLLNQRMMWLTRQASRLPRWSNGRRKKQAEAQRCHLLAATLSDTLQGKATPKDVARWSGTTRQEQRAIRLLQQIDSAAHAQR